MEKLEALGNMPQARFGHTITFITKGKAILFGGATGDTGRFSITGETYSFDVQTRIWKKIDTTGAQPSPRAAHAAVAVEINQIVVYGGATGGSNGYSLTFETFQTCNSTTHINIQSTNQPLVSQFSSSSTIKATNQISAEHRNDKIINRKKKLKDKNDRITSSERLTFQRILTSEMRKLSVS
ncbi:hypothetical protein ABPG74_008869 [Tetrahymena malaccensis]